MRQIVLDTETTGLSFAAGHRIIEIGCVEIKNYMPTGETFHTYLYPGRLIDPGATQVHGITDEMLFGKPEFHQIVGPFLEFLGDSPLVIHNAPFDMGFINGELGKIGLNPLPMTRAIDTVKMARTLFPGSPANLDALCRRFEIDLSARTKHGALLDAMLLAEVYLQLSGGRQPDLDLLRADKQKHSVSMMKERALKPMRHFQMSEEELLKHKAFVQTLKNPLWEKVG